MTTPETKSDGMIYTAQTAGIVMALKAKIQSLEAENGALLKAIENLSHAVSACNYAQGTYLLEAAKEVVELVYPSKEGGV